MLKFPPNRKTTKLFDCLTHSVLFLISVPASMIGQDALAMNRKDVLNEVLANIPKARHLQVKFDANEGFTVLVGKPPAKAKIPKPPEQPKQEHPKEKLKDNTNRVKDDAAKSGVNADKQILILDNLPLEAGFQSDDDIEFPHIEGGKPRIPHILHQIWMTGNVTENTDPVLPEKFVENVKTFLHHNPNWTYFFWTDFSARKLIVERHKKMLYMYDNAPKLVVKTDILRYVLMYEFGGMYSDLDTKNLRPLDIATTKYPCIVLPIPFEHAALWTFMPYRLCNGGMMCRPKHPFFKQCIDALPDRANFSFFPKIAGPLFIDEMYKIYNNISKDDLYKIDLNQKTNTPYFFKGNKIIAEENTLYIPNTKYFLNSPSPALKSAETHICNKTVQTNLTQRACATVKRLGYERNSVYSFITHQFAASWMGANAKRLELVPLNNVTTNYKVFGKNG